MMTLTLHLSEEAERRLEAEATKQGLPVEDYAERVLIRSEDQVRPGMSLAELWLAARAAGAPASYQDFAQVLAVLSELPGPEEILALKASPELDERVETLIQRNRESGLSPAEQSEWEAYEFLDHVVTLAKIKAQTKLRA